MKCIWIKLLCTNPKSLFLSLAIQVNNPPPSDSTQKASTGKLQILNETEIHSVAKFPEVFKALLGAVAVSCTGAPLPKKFAKIFAGH